ncbi:hypothetical protein [Streptacidiphilus sp. MAP5-3]|uniref:hypothetical protein n=1 Tax=unclassified Streptacidiphilus TaxID=2643834 RepID=UPI0035161F7F
MASAVSSSFIACTSEVSGEPLRRAEAAFQLLAARSYPLTVVLGPVHEGLPDEPVDVVELRSLLLHPSLGYPARSAVWAHLLRLMAPRTEAGREWRLAGVGLVMWGLRRVAARTCRQLPGHNVDLQQEILAAAWAALEKALTTDEAEAGKVPSRVVWAADRAARSYRAAQEALVAHRDETEELPMPARQPIHPDALLTLAVRQGVLTTQEAAVVGDYRLGGVATRTLAEQAGVTTQAVDKRRQRAEARLIRAITSGRLAFTEIEHLIES